MHIQKKRMDNGMVYPGVIPLEILREFRKERYDCIHVHHPMFVDRARCIWERVRDSGDLYISYTLRGISPLYPLLSGREKTPVLWRRTVGWIRRKVIPAYMRWFADQCDMVLAPSAGMRQVIKDYGTSTRVEVFPTGLDEAFFRKDEGRAAEIRSKFGKREEISSGHSVEAEKEKNYEFLLGGSQSFAGRGEMISRCSSTAAEAGWRN